jgi:hypothetical protein
MNYLDLIIKVAAFLGALGVICGAIIKVFNIIIKPLKDALTELNTHIHENYMGILRLTIMSNEMPIGERIVAGHKYLKEGGNGEVKSFLKSEFNIDETVDNADHYKK